MQLGGGISGSVSNLRFISFDLAHFEVHMLVSAVIQIYVARRQTGRLLLTQLGVSWLLCICCVTAHQVLVSLC